MFWFNQCDTGESAEGGQYGETGREVKTGKLQTLSAGACKPNARVNMTRYMVKGRFKVIRNHIMYKTEITKNIPLLMNEQIHVIVILTV